MIRPIAVFVAMLACVISTPAAQSYAERLGWGPNDVVLILHIDDAGMSHSSNLGVIKCLEEGVANSFSIMMPCSWVPEMAKYIKENPEVDAGLHLTMTSEWDLYRWGPLAGKPQVPGLVDHQGCLWDTVQLVVQNATPDEIEKEIRAQIDRAENLGIKITHLDSHMGTLFARRDYFERFAKVGIEKRIPILVAGGHLTYASKENPEAVQGLRPFVEKIWDAGLPVLDDLHTATYDWEPEEKKERFMELLKEIKPGVTEILFHASLPTEVFPLITGSSESRRADANILLDPEVKKLIEERKIILTTWKELMERRSRVK